MLPSGLSASGQLPATNLLRLAIGVALRDPKGLEDSLAQLYDRTSPNFRHYLTPEAFTKRFGPTADDYQGVIEFAQTNGLVVTATYANRLLLDVSGSVANVQRALHITLLTYRHPSESRDFFAPDVEPSVGARLAIADIGGLNSYTLPRPRIHRPGPSATAGPRLLKGPASGCAYMGKDFRAAYLPGVSLTGASQIVGLVAFDGYFASDISAYAAQAGITNLPVEAVLLDGFDGQPTAGMTSGNDEVSLDIEQVMAMAPGLLKIKVYEAGPEGQPNDILNAMTSDTEVKQFSCSWGWPGGPSTTTDNIFKQMAAQGQSFFCASGDSDAYTTGADSVNGVDNTSLANAPASCPYITIVGGTTLSTTGHGGAWVSERVWNPDRNSGSSEGISSYYSIPSWQEGVSMAANGGSTSRRNIPDVALVADNVFVIYGRGLTATMAGTSCAAPLWAGLTALVNQQAIAHGRPVVGFLNPAIYALGKSSTYGSAFHDITTGNSFSRNSPSLFAAVAGYDLCTGWGTPAGQALIDSLAGSTNPMAIFPATGFTATGPVGGPFIPGSQTLLLTNSGNTSLTWSLVNTSAWLNVAPSEGILAGQAGTELSARLAPATCSLEPAIYTTALLVTNDGGGAFTLFVTLNVGQSIVQNGGFETGNFAGWTLFGDPTDFEVTVYNAVEDASTGINVVHSGDYGAFLGDPMLASLSQSLPTIPGQYYVLSLWLDNSTSGSGEQFRVL